jgi:hypothetical protein
MRCWAAHAGRQKLWENISIADGNRILVREESSIILDRVSCVEGLDELNSALAVTLTQFLVKNKVVVLIHAKRDVECLETYQPTPENHTLLLRCKVL